MRMRIERGKGLDVKVGEVVARVVKGSWYALDLSGTEVTGINFDEGLAGLGTDTLLGLALAFPARINIVGVSTWRQKFDRSA